MTTPVYLVSIRRSIVYLASLLTQTGGDGKKRSQKISFLCNLELATCSSLIRTGGTSLDFVPLLCRLFLGCISTYFSELFRARHLECCLSAVAIPQKSTKPHKCSNAETKKIVAYFCFFPPCLIVKHFLEDEMNLFTKLNGNIFLLFPPLA